MFHAFLSTTEFFQKSTFSKNSFWNTIRVSNSLDSDQARLFVGPDLGPNCLQRLSAGDDTSRQNANTTVTCQITMNPCQEHDALITSAVAENISTNNHLLRIKTKFALN